MKICSVDGCNDKYYALDYCNKHYQRFKKYGDPLFLIKKYNVKHDMYGTPEYISWKNMKRRCLNKNDKAYFRYGGRGITICDHWKDSFLNFHKDMGLKPFPKAQIDRIDNDGNYEPENCEWVTHTKNIRHTSATRLTIKTARKIRKEYSSGKITQKDLSKKYDLHKTTIFFIVHNKQWKEC